MNITERFLKYVSFDTQSNEASTTYPTTAKQLALAKYLQAELKSLKIETTLDNNGIVYGHLPKNIDKGYKIGYIAHMDTSPDASGANIKPRIINNYDGKPIKLNNERIMDPKVFTSLKRHTGKNLIVTDGNTLLGADDKAGIAIIVSFVEKLIQENQKHNDIYLAFTPDEEVGKGTDNFDLSKFPADFAYTIDGGEIENIEYENFNAASATVEFIGNSVHPGSAKGKMLNASSLAMEFDNLLPTFDRPEYTEKYEGFNHLIKIDGSCEKATSIYIIRNHDKKLLAKQKQDFLNNANFLNTKYHDEVVKVNIKDSYANMFDLIKTHPEITDLAKQAIKEVVGKVNTVAIRGGTDGAMLTYKGLLTPNLGTGGYNYHGPYEYLCINEHQKMVEVLLKLNELNIK